MAYAPSLIRLTLADAQQALHEGDLSRANRLLQRLHAAGHADAASHQMLAIISLKLGFFDQARRHMEAARQLIQPSDRRERFLVIRAWGAGFWADVLHTIHGLALAEASGRTPIVHWGLECRYRRAGIENAWPLYFEPVSPHTIATAEVEGLSIFPPKWTGTNLRALRVNKDDGEWSSLSGLYLLNRPEHITVFDFFTELEDLAPWFAPGHPLATDTEAELGRLYRRHLRLTHDLEEELDRAEAAMIGRRPTIAIHYRTQSYQKIMTETPDRKGLGPELFAKAVDRYLASHPDAGVYLTTDFTPAVIYFRERYRDRLSCREVTRVARVEEQSVELQQRHDGVTLAREVLIDTFLATRCDAFVGDSASGLSQAIAKLKDWLPESVTLFRPGYAAPAGQLRRYSDPSPWWNPTN